MNKPSAKPTLEEMAEACLEEGSLARSRLQRFYAENPGAPPAPTWEREALVWQAAGEVFAVMWKYEQRSREFVAELMVADKQALERAS